MRKAEPPADNPVSQRLHEELTKHGWTQTQLAEILERPLQAVNEIYRGKKTVTAWTALQFEAAFNVPAEEWMRLRYEHELAEARRNGYAHR